MFSHLKSSIPKLMLILGGISILAAGCIGEPSVFQPRSTNAGSIYNLIVIIFIIAAIVFVVVEGILIYASIRFNRKKDAGLPDQIEGNTRLEIGWTLLPAVVLLIVFFVMLRVLLNLGYQQTSVSGTNGVNPVAADTPLRVRVIGHQWWWEFQYPDLKITTANELHIPTNTVVNFDVESVDVIHSFWVPQLGGKIDAVPGQVNQTWFNVNTPGEYQGQCSEFCGEEHAFMLLVVIAEPMDQFQNWVKGQQAGIPTLTGAAAQGEQVFLNGACIGCHTINGTKAQGTVGPNLTHFASRGEFAGAILPNTPENVARWLQNPPGVKPGTLMPNLHLSQDQISQLVAFLESLK